MRSKKSPARGPRSARTSRTRNHTARKPHARAARRTRHVSDAKARSTAVPAAVSIYAASRSIAADERPRLTLHTESDGDVATADRSSRLGPWSLAGSAACVLIVLFLVGAPTPRRVDTAISEPAVVPAATVSSTRPASEAVPQIKDPAVRLAVKKPEPPATLPLTRIAPETHAPMPVVLAASVPPPLPKLMAAAEPPAVHAAPAPAAAIVDPSVFTVTGCLDVNKDGFRLNNTEGENVPQSRSWKSGFLKKRSATILLEDTGRVGLGAHVGELVTLTGKLEDRDMQVRSLRRVAASCEN